MEKLETLKNLVADWFAQAENKSEIEKLSALKKACDEVEVEQNKLQADNKELLKDYKELVTHTSFSDQSKAPTDNIGASAPSFDEALAEFMKKI